ncbi:hypothetical protein KIPB_000321 [Kipferlia bialata]|uniref:FYVE-type domain-containing protein n=1 Tax=Kipferlia bialata TaxID=797122 RepID=A0A9K3GDD9_9EUKA|nr:hypothetical protein KIPB_000321 [Kipferlia bialata]|eukprot:g321.t1
METGVDFSLLFTSVIRPKLVGRTEWLEDQVDDICFICDLPFNFIKRRHHCRRCGRIVCADCSRYTQMTDAATAALQCLSRTTALAAMRTVHMALSGSGDPVKARLSLPAADPIPAGGAVVWRCVEGVQEYISVADQGEAGESVIAALERLKAMIRECDSTRDVWRVTDDHERFISTAVAMSLAYSDYYGSGAGKANSIVKWGQCHVLVTISKRDWMGELKKLDPERAKGPKRTGARGTGGRGGRRGRHTAGGVRGRL